VIPLPGEGYEALEDWLSAQAPDHGREAWFVRMVYAIEMGDWSRARTIAECARVLSILRAYGRAGTEKERDAFVALLKRKPATNHSEC
jgi:hypothetical protein